VNYSTKLLGAAGGFNSSLGRRSLTATADNEYSLDEGREWNLVKRPSEATDTV
jgi:hypothetical protein